MRATFQTRTKSETNIDFDVFIEKELPADRTVNFLIWTQMSDVSTLHLGRCFIVFHSVTLRPNLKSCASDYYYFYGLLKIVNKKIVWSWLPPPLIQISVKLLIYNIFCIICLKLPTASTALWPQCSFVCDCQALGSAQALAAFYSPCDNWYPLQEAK